MNARINPIDRIIKAIVSLAKFFMEKAICVIAEKQNAEKAMRKTRVFLLFAQFSLNPAKKVNLLFLPCKF